LNKTVLQDIDVSTLRPDQSQFGEFPWMVLFMHSPTGEIIGGGSLIHPQAVLTIAHIFGGEE